MAVRHDSPVMLPVDTSQHMSIIAACVRLRSRAVAPEFEMAKQKTLATRSMTAALLRAETYKPTQGLKVRKTTGAVIFLTALVAAWQLYHFLDQLEWWTWLQGITVIRPQYVFPVILVAVGLWLAWRIVNIPSFADFLIKVEGELAKVTWPSRQQLIRASLVVIVLMFLFAIMLFTFDLFWNSLFHMLGILHDNKTTVTPASP